MRPSETRFPIRASLALGILLLAPAALADVIHLKNGSSLTVDQWWEEEGEIRYRRAGGVIGIPRSQVDRIESAPAPSPSARGATAPRSRAARPARGAATPPPGPIAVAPPPDGAGVRIEGSGPEAWRAHLARIESAAGKPGSDGAGARGQAAVLHTLLGNDAARSGDLDAAESHYRSAIDYDPELVPPVLNLARLRITQGRNDDAERLVQDALALRPEDPAALFLMGEVAYRSDRLDEAIESWERSLALRPDADLAARLGKAKKEREAEEGFYRSDAPHFTLKYDGGKASEALSDEILDHLESAYGDLTSRFNVYPASVIIVTLYSREAFYDVTESPRWVGGLFDGQIRIPIGGLTRLTAVARGVLSHELTHCIVWHKTRGNCPKWLQEGLAQWVEGKSARSHARSLRQKYVQASPSDVAGDFSYPLALALTEQFLGTLTFSHMLDLLEALGGGSDVEAAFHAATGQGFEEFLAAWIRGLSNSEGSS